MATTGSATRTARALALTALLATAGAGLAGCGFTPLYAQAGVVPALSHVAVKTPNTRLGYLMKQGLEDALATDRGAPPAYRLEVTTQQTRYQRGLQPDDTASRYELDVTFTYVLTDAATGKVVYQNHQPLSLSYPATDQPYAGVAAQKDSEERAANTAADYIKTDLAQFFASR